MTGFRYKIFNHVLRSSEPLPGLSPAYGRRVDLEVEWRGKSDRSSIDESAIEWRQTVATPEGQVVIECGKVAERYLLRFPGLCDFLVVPEEGQIRVASHSGEDALVFTSLLLDQVIPRLLSQRGHLVLHAGSVALDESRCVAFVGETGAGKSTLVSSFHSAGARLLTDDALLVEPHDGGLRCCPAYRGLRLWPDSEQATASKEDCFQPVAPYTRKRRLTGMDSGSRQQDMYPLAAIFLLDQPQLGSSKTGPVIEEAGGVEATMALVRSMFVMDSSEADMQRKSFQLISAVLNSNTPILRLRYPRRYECLPSVREVIERASREWVCHS